ncbi:hypothetical protein C1645_789136 [Glomus cerebriforme]|uniref:Jacalin-type lectin domain-containing protein n=1 Tax=Glomus cerebriforme TaxID=658196 RepID=A0A397SHS8_9GLOM|nr:hypothetical protein C1645_789136 [Glomus cerebriforme]
MDGISHDYVGNKYGGNGSGRQSYTFSDDEQISRISGRYGKYLNYTAIVKYLEISSQKRTYRFGTPSGDTLDTTFILPGGAMTVIYGSGGIYMDSIGTYAIEEVIQPTVTETITLSSSTSQDHSLIIALSCTVGILGLCLLVTVGILWRKFHVSKGTPLPVMSYN